MSEVPYPGVEPQTDALVDGGEVVDLAVTLQVVPNTISKTSAPWDHRQHGPRRLLSSFSQRGELSFAGHVRKRSATCLGWRLHSLKDCECCPFWTEVEPIEPNVDRHSGCAARGAIFPPPAKVQGPRRNTCRANPNEPVEYRCRRQSQLVLRVSPWLLNSTHGCTGDVAALRCH